MQHEVKMQLRLPAEIRDALALDARNNHRSMNGQIIAILSAHFLRLGIGTESHHDVRVTSGRT